MVVPELTFRSRHYALSLSSRHDAGTLARRPGRKGGLSVYVAELWRYPVKSLGGERLDAAEIGPDGIAGDRRVLVLDADTGRIVTSRRKPSLLGLRATLGPDGEPFVDGRPWADAASAQAVVAAAGPSARLVPWDGPERFDVLPLLVATTARSRRSATTGGVCARTSSSAASTASPSGPGPGAASGSGTL